MASRSSTVKDLSFITMVGWTTFGLGAGLPGVRTKGHSGVDTLYGLILRRGAAAVVVVVAVAVTVAVGGVGEDMLADADGGLMFAVTNGRELWRIRPG